MQEGDEVRVANEGKVVMTSIDLEMPAGVTVVDVAMLAAQEKGSVTKVTAVQS